MPHRQVAHRELAELCAGLGHPVRLGVLFALEEGELDVTSLQKVLGVPQSLVSQSLARLRTMHLVSERREGRHVHYRLALPALAGWLAQGLILVEQETAAVVGIHDAIERTRRARTQAQREPAAAKKTTPARTRARRTARGTR